MHEQTCGGQFGAFSHRCACSWGLQETALNPVSFSSYLTQCSDWGNHQPSQQLMRETQQQPRPCWGGPTSGQHRLLHKCRYAHPPSKWSHNPPFYSIYWSYQFIIDLINLQCFLKDRTSSTKNCNPVIIYSSPSCSKQIRFPFNSMHHCYFLKIKPMDICPSIESSFHRNVNVSKSS